MDINKQNFCSNHVADLTLPGTCCASLFKGLPAALSLVAILSDGNLLSYCFDRFLYSAIPLSADLHALPIPGGREFTPKQIHNNT